MNTYLIETLNKNNLNGAIALVKECFKHISHSTGLPERSLRAALNPDCAKPHKDMAAILTRDFWVLQDNGRVCGVMGLMEMKADSETTDWLNWFCVSPAYRKRGYRRILLERAAEISKSRNKKHLKLWTSNAPNEKDAQYLYEKMGFHITSEEESTDGESSIIIYRCKTL
ncbi:MAG: GNAT family N-acetyltransferase [Dongiaceae bacterium]